MKTLLILIYFLVPVLCIAEQPRLNKAIKAFQSAPATIEAGEKLKLEGYTQKDASGAVINGIISDEGLEGTYFVSIYFEKGADPWERKAKIITGLVIISSGHIQSVKLIDNTAAEESLFKIQ